MQQPPSCAPAQLARWSSFFIIAISLGSFLSLAYSEGLGLLDPELSEVRKLTFFIVFYIHAAVSLYDGCFGRLRRLTWPALILIAAAYQVIAFTGPIPPRWIAQLLAGLPVSADGPLFAAAPLGLLLLDVGAAQFGLVRRLRQGDWRVWLGAAGLAVLLLLVLAANGVAPRVDAPATAANFQIVPSWHSLPYYAMLRAVPDKLASVTLAALALLVPLFWPRAGAAWCRTGPARHVYQAMCAGLIAAWLGLGWSGSQFPEDLPMAVGRLCTACFFAFFVITPVLARWSRRHAPAAVLVDDVFR